MTSCSKHLLLLLFILCGTTLAACGTRVAPVAPPNHVDDSASY